MSNPDTEPGINKDLSAPAPSYSRNLTAKEREDRRDQLLVQHRERRAAVAELTAAKAAKARAVDEVKRIERKIETIDEMCETLALEADTGHAVIPQQLKLGDVPVLAGEDGQAVDDPRDEEDEEADHRLRDGDDDAPSSETDDFPVEDPDAGEPGVRPRRNRRTTAQPSA